MVGVPSDRDTESPKASLIICPDQGTRIKEASHIIELAQSMGIKETLLIT